MVRRIGPHDIVDMILRLSGSATLPGVGLAAVAAAAVGAGAMWLGRGHDTGARAAARAAGIVNAAPTLPAPAEPMRPAVDAGATAALGRELFLSSCITCYGP